MEAGVRGGAVKPGAVPKHDAVMPLCGHAGRDGVLRAVTAVGGVATPVGAVVEEAGRAGAYPNYAPDFVAHGIGPDGGGSPGRHGGEGKVETEEEARCEDTFDDGSECNEGATGDRKRCQEHTQVIRKDIEERKGQAEKRGGDDGNTGEEEQQQEKEPTRTLEFDDDWGENTGVASVFGEYRDDMDVVEKHQREENEAEERRLAEKARALETAEKQKQPEEPTRTLEFDDGWGENTGVTSVFGEYRDDEDVMQKSQREEDEAIERRLEEKARALETAEEEEQPEEPTRTLEFDDGWGENTGVTSVFGEYRDDDDVMQKHQREEDEAEERRLEEEARVLETTEEPE